MYFVRLGKARINTNFVNKIWWDTQIIFFKSINNYSTFIVPTNNFEEINVESFKTIINLFNTITDLFKFVKKDIRYIRQNQLELNQLLLNISFFPTTPLILIRPKLVQNLSSLYLSYLVSIENHKYLHNQSIKLSPA